MHLPGNTECVVFCRNPYLKKKIWKDTSHICVTDICIKSYEYRVLNFRMIRLKPIYSPRCICLLLTQNGWLCRTPKCNY